jgi:2-dehydro-3-deoxyphosphogluconate aldolase/(4S)-4-hydroxy-2-oxoglutarate aldolase
MARFSRIETVLMMKQNGVVPLFYHKDTEICKKVLKACYDGGIRIFEFTNRGDFAHETFSELNKYAISSMPELILGTGSVVDAATAALYIQLGSNFIVSPLLNEETAKVCNRRKVLWMPGCGSVSEISKAEELGAEIIKIYPASQLGGPGFIKAIKAPCPWTEVMPSGGVEPTKENIESWFNAGACCVGMGSKLITKDILSENNYNKLSQRVKETLHIIKSIKN